MLEFVPLECVAELHIDMIGYTQFYTQLLQELDNLHGRLLKRHAVFGSRSYWKHHFYFKAIRFAVMRFEREACELHESLPSKLDDKRKLDSLISHLLEYSFQKDLVIKEYLTNSSMAQIDKIRAEIEEAYRNRRLPSLSGF